MNNNTKARKLYGHGEYRAPRPHRKRLLDDKPKVAASAGDISRRMKGERTGLDSFR